MQQQIKISGFTSALRGTAVQQRAGSSSRSAAAAAAPVQAATQLQTRRLKVGDKAAKPPPPPPKKAAASPKTGTKVIGGSKTGTKVVTGTKAVGGTRKITAIEVFSKERLFRQKQQQDSKPAPKILSRIEQLKLLSKLEQSGLLSLAEKNGVTLSGLEQSGLLSAAEKFGVVGLVADRKVPGTLYTLAAALLAAGPAAVYFLPDDSAGIVGLQAVVALACIAGGSAAWGGATLLSNLQKS